jgi:hypothetical protein
LDCYNRYEVIFSPFLLPEIAVYFARIENILAGDLVFLRITPIFAVYLVVQAILDLDEYVPDETVARFDASLSQGSRLVRLGGVWLRVCGCAMQTRM